MYLRGTIVSVLGLTLGVGMASETNEPPQPEIVKLVANLGNENFRIRDTAMRQLDSLGQLALRALREQSNANDFELSQRAKTLIARIEVRKERTEGVVRASGMRFRPVVDPEWRAPQRGVDSTVRMGLEVKNESSEGYRIASDTRIVIKDASGAQGPVDYFRDYFSQTYSPRLRKNGIYIVPVEAWLVEAGADFDLWTKNNGTYTILRKLRKGTYQVGFVHETSAASGHQADIWTGVARTGFVTVTIK
jgi:hypothetical protein